MDLAILVHANIRAVNKAKHNYYKIAQVYLHLKIV